MWPTKEFPGYGSFVKNVVDGLNENEIYCSHFAIIGGRATSTIDKLAKYINFYFKILYNYFRKYDFIYVHFPNQALPILIPLYSVFKKRIIINLHGEDLLYKKQGLSLILGKLNDWFMRRVDAIIVPSHYYKNRTLERINCCPDKIFVSPSGGINPNSFYCEDLNITIKDELHLGYVGRIDPNKGWQQFIDTLKLLPKDFKYQATIIGNGSQVTTLINELKSINSSCIQYVPHVFQQDLRRYYSSFDLLIFPTMREEESLGLVGIEAMACGTPVIGSNIGGIPSYLISGYNGFLVQPGKVDEIVEYIIYFSRLDQYERYRMRQNCISLSKHYYASNVLSSLATFIKEQITNK